MSRLISACVLVAMLLAAPCIGIVATPRSALAASGKLTVQTPLHVDPDPSATVLALLPEGTEVSIDGPPIDGFYPVSTGEISGWMRGETLLLAKDVPPETAPEFVADDMSNLPPEEPAPTSEQYLSAGSSLPADPALPADIAPMQEAVTPEGSAELAPADQPAATEPAVTDTAAELVTEPAPEAVTEPAPEPAPEPALESANSENLAPTDPQAQPPADSMHAAENSGTDPSTSADPSATTADVPPDGAAPAENAPSESTAATSADSGPTGPAGVSLDSAIRTGPGPEYELIFTVPGGSTVEQTGQVINGYVSVRYKEVVGWLDLNNVAPPSDFVPETVPEEAAKPVETKIPRPGSGLAFAKVDLSLREGPSATSPPIASVPAGSRVVLTGVMEGGFQRVTFRDQIGWIATDYLQMPPNPEEASGAKIKNYSRREIVRIIYAAADRYGQSREAMLRVAECESNLNPYAVHPSGSYGLFQFIRTTWRSTPYGDEDIFDPRANANAAGWMWAQGRKSEWVCQ